MITQTQIAELVGVSQMTVHKALHGHQKVSAATREKILKVARKHGYRTNAAASTMRTGRTGCIALLLSTVNYRSLVPQAMLDGIQHALAAHELRLLMDRLPDDILTSADDFPGVMREWRSDGLLINYNAEVPDGMVDLIEREGLPYVWLNARCKQDAVHPDDKEGARELTERLIELGHRRISYLDTTRGAHYSPRARFNGYSQALRDRSLAPEHVGSFEDRESGTLVDLFRTMLKKENAPTACICYSMHEATCLLHAAGLEGIAVPDELSIAVFAEEQLDPLGVRLSTAVIPQKEVGRRGVELLQQRLNAAGRHVPSVKIPFAWKEGKTTGRAPTR